MKARQLLGTLLLLLAPISVLSASNAAERGADSLRLSVGVDASHTSPPLCLMTQIFGAVVVVP